MGEDKEGSKERGEDENRIKGGDIEGGGEGGEERRGVKVMKDRG